MGTSNERERDEDVDADETVEEMTLEEARALGIPEADANAGETDESAGRRG